MHPPVDPHDLELGLDQATGILRQSTRIAVLTGAGVSAESGVATFRGAEGLWEGHPLEDVATPMGFERDPALVWRFYNARRAALRAVQPNPGHVALKQMEDRWGSEQFALITQNVDGLHRIAGSRRILELHGSILRIRCSECTFSEERGLEELPDLPRCEECGHLLRPAVVWFYEMLPEGVWSEAAQAVGSCQCLLVAGTSAVVYPAAGLIDAARAAGAAVIEVNLEPTAASRSATVGLYGPSGEVLPRLLERLESGEGAP